MKEFTFKLLGNVQITNILNQQRKNGLVKGKNVNPFGTKIVTAAGAAREGGGQRQTMRRINSFNFTQMPVRPITSYCRLCVYCMCVLLCWRPANKVILLCVCVRSKGCGFALCASLAATPLPGVCIYIICHSPAAAFIRSLRGLI